MGIEVGGSKRGIMSEMNVVPLIDVLLVLLVIFMIIPHRQVGLKAEIPQPAEPMPQTRVESDIVVVQVLSGGSLKINEQPVSWEALRRPTGRNFQVACESHGVRSRRRHRRISGGG
jgi:biopolymer transport protein ExbD